MVGVSSKIKQRIEEFKSFDRSNSMKVFEELVFCLLTPQSKALAADMSVKKLIKKELLFDGGAKEVSAVLRVCGVRFHNTKARRVVKARGVDLVFDRDWLVANVDGLGLKEASHFLRNVGVFGYAILDRHVLKNLVKLGVISEVPGSLNRKRYLEIEEKFRAFADESGLSIEELDLLFWSSETGFVFK
jgi:N-glycosylase/DNA lyase